MNVRLFPFVPLKSAEIRSNPLESAGIRLESASIRAESVRNPCGIRAESVAGIRRNPWPESIGVRDSNAQSGQQAGHLCREGQAQAISISYTGHWEVAS